MRKTDDGSNDTSLRATAGDAVVRVRPEWTQKNAHLDRYVKANDPDDKNTPKK